MNEWNKIEAVAALEIALDLIDSGEVSWSDVPDITRLRLYAGVQEWLNEV